MNTIAIDPGGTTGIAFRLHKGAAITTTTDTPEGLWTFLIGHSWDEVVCEQFNASIISKYGLYTVRLIGGVEALCLAYKFLYIKRTPQNRKAFQRDAHATLCALGEPFVDHQEDALAHLLAWEAIRENGT